MGMCRFTGSNDKEYSKVAAAFDRIQKKLLERYEGQRSMRPEETLQGQLEALWFDAIGARLSRIKVAHSQTCKWMLGKSEYQDWLDASKTPQHHGFLWIKGKPGSGKSTLMKFILANTNRRKQGVVSISFFFNARGEDLEKSTLGMYRSLLYQLLKALPNLHKNLKFPTSRLSHDQGIYLLEEDVQNLFGIAIQNLGNHRVLCFIDALDECGEGQMRELVDFLESIGEITGSSQVQFRVCLSSRHYPHISIQKSIEMVLEGQEGHDDDIVRYLNSELKAGDGAQIKSIKDEILQRSGKIFLWVVLVVQILNKEYDHGRIHALKKRLREIPKGLDKLFEDILTRDQENTEDLILCLQWVLYAKRPLRREELYYAILSGIDHDTSIFSSSETPTSQDMDRFILSCSKGLAETTKLKAQTVQFIHESVRDFLLGKNGFNRLRDELRVGQSHERLKQCCSLYLEAYISDHSPLGTDPSVASNAEVGSLREAVAKKFPLLEYAVNHVLFHADVADGSMVSQEAFVKSFALRDWILLNNIFEKFQIRRYTPGASLLYILAEKNHSNLIKTQRKQDPDPDSTAERLEPERHGAPLYAALANSKVSQDTIWSLLTSSTMGLHESGELQNAQNKRLLNSHQTAPKTNVAHRSRFSRRTGQSLLHWAASEGHELVVNVCLTINSWELNLRDESSQTPLSLAASEGHESIVKTLLANENTNPNSSDSYHRSPLSWAVQHNHRTTVKLLLDREDTDPNMKDSINQTPLYCAASNGFIEIAKLLLTREDTDPNSKGRFDQTPLHYAALNGSTEIAKLLLAREDTDPNMKDSTDQTPLHYAALNGSTEIAKLLLTREDTDPNSTGRFSQTPLHRAASNGSTEVAKLLLTREDTDPNSTGRFSQTPLHRAASNGSTEIAKLLLIRDEIDPNAKCDDSSTTLHLAVMNGHTEVVKLLLMREDIDPNPKHKYCRTLLSLTISNGYTEIATLIRAHKNFDPASESENNGLETIGSKF